MFDAIMKFKKEETKKLLERIKIKLDANERVSQVASSTLCSVCVSTGAAG